MKLSQLLQNIKGETKLQDVEINAITCDSRQVEQGSLFVCVTGLKSDGHVHAAQAIESGAVAVVCERDLGLEQQILVENSRIAYAKLCANFYANPSKDFKLVGVTGTNGKTTITNLLKHVLEFAGEKVGLIGTIQNEIDDMEIPAKYTTPDPAQLQALFSRMKEAGCTYVVMEVSSHALDQHRLEGCHFESAVFTNLTQDHLDYHGTMENYFLAKKKLFDMTEHAVINWDDEYGRRLAGMLTCDVKTFSMNDNGADYTAKDIKGRADSTTFQLVGNGVIQRIRFPMPGQFSVSNAMAAAVCALSLGFDIEQVGQALNSCPPVKGRCEVLDTGTDYTVICDYAHSPDSLEKIISAVREFAPGRVVTLFGCAGNRDRTKRPKMGEIVSRLSDFVVLTSDNPRNEDPMQIIEDALPGIKEHDTPCHVEPDRYTAIEWALEHAQKDDVLILAGKGHEDYQVLDFGTIHFDEREVVAQLLERKRQGK